MKNIHVVWFAMSLAGRLAFAVDDAAPIDWQHARQLYQRQQQGEQLTPQEQVYIEKAKQLHTQQQKRGSTEIDWPRAQQLHRREQQGEKLSADEQAYLDKAKATLHQRPQGSGQAQTTGPAPGGKDAVGLIPLCDLGTQKYKGEDGGLYGGGKNEPPAAQVAAAEKELKKIRPLDAKGKPAEDGKIVLLSVGMSNTTMEFSRFKELADADPEKSSKLVIVDGAQGGQTPPRWTQSPDSRVWQTVSERMNHAGVTPQQVQLAWLKQANAHPTEAFPEHAKKLQADMTLLLNMLKTKFPNLRIAYLSSRIYAGYATTPLNPEPFAYEGAFVMRWLIQDQIKGEPKLNFDPARGTVTAPLLLWGPYLWADGMTPRKAEGLTWTRNDLGAGDGTHPSMAGRQKVAEQLLKFFHTNPLAREWFLAKP